MFHKHLQSFIRRERAMLPHVRAKFEVLLTKYGLRVEDGAFNRSKVFARNAPLIAEIGFGSGEVLLASAKEHPEVDFLGIEVYRPGIFALLSALEDSQIENVRVYSDDAIDVLKKCLPEASLDEIRLFFPDPWPKRRHHKRRLVQNAFIDLLFLTLKAGGIFHFVTDWEEYAKHVLKIMAGRNDFVRGREISDKHVTALGGFNVKDTKFGKRSVEAGCDIFDLVFLKNKI